MVRLEKLLLIADLLYKYTFKKVEYNCRSFFCAGIDQSAIDTETSKASVGVISSLFIYESSLK